MTDVTWLERRHQKLLDISQKYLTVDRPIDHTGSINPVRAQRRKECRCAPCPVRHLGKQALTAQIPAAQRGHVSFGPRLVNEDKTSRVNLRLVLFPTRPFSHDVRAILLGCEHGFFYG